MKKLHVKIAKYRWVFAGIIVLAGVLITPFMRHLAYLERGYHAIGGEYAPLIMSFIGAVIILDVFDSKKQNTRRD